MKWLALFLVVVVLVLHQDFWYFDQIRPLVFGFVPVGLAYHGAYSIVCAILMWVLVRIIWPADLEKFENVATPTAGSHAERAEDGGH